MPWVGSALRADLGESGNRVRRTARPCIEVGSALRADLNQMAAAERQASLKTDVDSLSDVFCPDIRRN